MITSPLPILHANILIVDDKPTNLRILSKMLSKQGYKVRAVISGKMAITAAQTMPPDLILLDIKMPDMDGYEVCQQLKKNPETCHIPVIFLSALQDVADKVKAFEVGGVDYIIKPFQFEEVLVRVSTHLELQAVKFQLQQLNSELERRVEQRNLDLKAAEQQLIYFSLHDGLTQLPNRSLFLKRVELALKRAKQTKNYLFAVLLLDLDRFKVINDSDGHIVGDNLLVAIGTKLETLIRSTDMVARFGGDEFAVLLEPISDISETIKVTQIIRQELMSPFQLEKREFFTSFSIGLTLSSPNYNDAQEMVRDADIAMGRAKKAGRGRYEIFDRQMHTQALKLLDLETDLRKAILKQEFQVHYQSILSLDNLKIVGFEALIRWQHTKKGLISPGVFIPVAEETGLIIPIGQIVLNEVCHQLKIWQNHWPLAQDLTISVNLSSQQLKEPEIINQIDRILETTELKSNHLKVEITESLLIENTQLATIILNKLRERNIAICLDDFGTGYSSLSYLHRFPVDTIKIDRSFINRIGEPDAKLEIVQSIITLAHNLGMNVVAEGIETQEQLSYLQSLQCDFGQGFFFSKPLNKEQAEKLITY